MVDHINAAGTNPLSSALTNALSNTQEAKELSRQENKAAANAYGQQSDGSSKTAISSKAKLLSQALAFARMSPTSPSDLTNTKVSDLKALYQAGGVDAVLARYDSNDLAESMLASPTAAFLRK